MIRFLRHFAVAAFLAVQLAAFVHADLQNCPAALVKVENKDVERYEAYAIRGVTPSKDIEQFHPQTGIWVTQRDGNGHPAQGWIRVLVDNPYPQNIYILSEYNGWGTRLSELDRLHPVPGTPYYEGRIHQLHHGMEYRLLVNGEQRLDPAAAVYTPSGYLNSVFWDFERPGAYRMTAPVADLRNQARVITETEVLQLVRLSGNGPAQVSNTYRYVAESGIIDELKRIGINAVEFVPFNASADNQDWRYRYQVYGLFAPSSAYGTPDEFARMVDEFNKRGIAVIMDAVVGHYPIRGNQGERALEKVGLHTWKKADGSNLYGGNWSPWGTYRYDYQNPFVRRFLIDSILHMVKRYRIGGIRFDNIDGIRFEPGGWQFLQELVTEIRAYRPELTTIGEMFFGENKITRALNDEYGLGINFRTDSDFFDFIKDNIQKRSEDIDMGRLQAAINNLWGWGEAMRVKYVTNHDEAANKRDGATGAYLASLVNGGDWFHVEGKTRAFAALAMMSGSAYMDMLQLRLLQEGSFNANPSVEWDVLRNQSQKRMYEFFAALSRYYRDNPAFAPHNLHPRIENHVDFNNKIISLMRYDRVSGKKVYILINLSHRDHWNYRFGLDHLGKLRVTIDSDRSEYGGGDRLASRLDWWGLWSENRGEHGKPHSINIPYLGSYGVVVLETE